MFNFAATFLKQTSHIHRTPKCEIILFLVDEFFVRKHEIQEISL